MVGRAAERDAGGGEAVDVLGEDRREVDRLRVDRVGLGAGLVAPPMNAAILASVPPSHAGMGSGVLNASRQIGTALGVAVFASFFHSGPAIGAVHLAMLCAGALYLASLGVVALAPRRVEAQARMPVVPLVD